MSALAGFTLHLTMKVSFNAAWGSHPPCHAPNDIHAMLLGVVISLVMLCAHSREEHYFWRQACQHTAVHLIKHVSMNIFSYF